jgi:glyoxylase-like metal-dependent hydrolase (beta-lactamase superfamily II)
VAYSIQIIKVASQEILGACVYYMQRFDQWESLMFSMILIRGEGKTIVVNSGLIRDLSLLGPLWSLWPGEREIVPEPDSGVRTALGRFGVRPEDVDYLLISPLQYYSTGNIDYFTKAEICVLERGWIDFHAPKYRDPFRCAVIPREILVHLVTDAWPRLRLLKDEDRILPGIRTFFTGIHHRSSMAVVIETAKGTAIYSDSFFKDRNIEQNLPIGYIENLEEAYLNCARIRREGQLFIPGFDPEIFERCPGGLVA